MPFMLKNILYKSSHLSYLTLFPQSNNMLQNYHLLPSKNIIVTSMIFRFQFSKDDT